MPTAQFIHHGDSIDYTPTSDISAGDVIQHNDLVGIAKRDAPANQLTALAVEGVFDMPKPTGTDTAIALGTTVYWDADEQQVTTDEPAEDPKRNLGKVVLAASDNDASVRVRLVQ